MATRDEPFSLGMGFLASSCARTRDLQSFCAVEGLAWNIFLVKRSFLQEEQRCSDTPSSRKIEYGLDSMTFDRTFSSNRFAFDLKSAYRGRGIRSGAELPI